jgi:hypothetical protein
MSDQKTAIPFPDRSKLSDVFPAFPKRQLPPLTRSSRLPHFLFLDPAIDLGGDYIKAYVFFPRCALRQLQVSLALPFQGPSFSLSSYTYFLCSFYNKVVVIFTNGHLFSDYALSKGTQICL